MIQKVKITIISLLFFLIFCLNNLKSQNTAIVITEQSFKMSSVNDFWFGFVEGDQILIEFDEVKNRDIAKFEVIEYPNNIVYSAKNIKDSNPKIVNIIRSGPYNLKFTKGGLFAKNLNLKVSRIPKNDSLKNINTTIVWMTKLDSTLVIEKNKLLVKSDTISKNIIDRVERVAATYSQNSNSTEFTFLLPSGINTENESEEIIAWAYWIGVGNQSISEFEKNKQNFLLDNSDKIATLIDPLAALALGVFIAFSSPPEGDNVKYSITYKEKSFSIEKLDFVENEYLIDSGNSVVVNGRVENKLEGRIKVNFVNDNYIDAINVYVKVTAVVVKNSFKMEEIKKYVVEEIKYPVLQH